MKPTRHTGSQPGRRPIGQDVLRYVSCLRSPRGVFLLKQDPSKRKSPQGGSRAGGTSQSCSCAYSYLYTVIIITIIILLLIIYIYIYSIQVAVGAGRELLSEPILVIIFPSNSKYSNRSNNNSNTISVTISVTITVTSIAILTITMNGYY